jgi:hypothetical protein
MTIASISRSAAKKVLKHAMKVAIVRSDAYAMPNLERFRSFQIASAHLGHSPRGYGHLLELEKPASLARRWMTCRGYPALTVQQDCPYHHICFCYSCQGWGMACLCRRPCCRNYLGRHAIHLSKLLALLPSCSRISLLPDILSKSLELAASALFS